MLTDFLNTFVHPSLHKAARDYLTNALPSEASSATTDSESATQAAVVRQSGEYRQRLWRNNNGACQDDTGRQIRFGLGNVSKRVNDICKSSDYIGITTINIHPEHVGQRIGVFTALEFKAPSWHLTAGDKRGNAQAAFGMMVEAAGGIFGFISEPGQYVELLRRWGVVIIPPSYRV